MEPQDVVPLAGRRIETRIVFELSGVEQVQRLALPLLFASTDFRAAPCPADVCFWAF